MQPHISLSAEKIASVAGFSITNSLFMTWIVMVVLFLLSWMVCRRITHIPSNLQLAVEIILDGLYGLFSSVVGENNIKMFFPLLASIFLFVVASNWSGLFPGVGTIGLTQEIKIVQKLISPALAVTAAVKDSPIESFEVPAESAAENQEAKTEANEFIPLLRGPTADLNTTLALALVSVFALQYYGFKSLGFGYLSKFINFSNPINFFLGILEIISEAAKVISFAFRLFGNIFAGEVLLTVIAFLMPLIAPLPFIGLELFVGVIQGLVFSMLTAVFLNMATVAHSEH